MKKYLALILALVLTFSIAGCQPKEPPQPDVSDPSESVQSSEVLSYSVTTQGFGGSVTVTIETQDGKLLSVSAVGEQETAHLGGAAIKGFNAETFPGFAGRELSTLSGDMVDSVTGASVTSKAVRDAFSSALAQAMGTVQGGTLADGVYSRTVYGNNYIMPFVVDVTLQGGAIQAIEVTDRGGEYSEYDDAILQSAIDNLIPRIIDAQSLAVDSITGATLSSNGIKTAVAEAIEAAGGDLTDWYAPVEKKTNTVTLDGYDVIVVGLGASGLAAYLSAAESGAAVFGLDSAAKVGGTSVLTSGPMDVNPTFPTAMGEEVIPVDESSFVDLWMSETDNGAKRSCVELIVGQSGDAVDWLVENYGFTFSAPFPFMYPDLPVWSVYLPIERTPLQMYQQALEKANTLHEKNQYMLELKGTDILKDASGAVSGVRAQSYDGTVYEIHAPAVILCTGGFGGNAKLCEEMFGYPIKLHGMYQNDGVMLLSAINDLGAGTYSMDSAGMAHTGRTAATLRLDNVVPSHNKVLSSMANNADLLCVNEDGKRFTNEGSGFTPAETYWKAGSQYYYTIVDQEYMDHVKNEGLDSVYFMMNSQDFTDPEVYPNTDTSYVLAAGEPISDLDVVIEGAIELGTLFRADSIDALGQMLGMSSLADTCKTYNAACAAGEDKEFGKDPSLLLPLHEDSAHYYAIKVAAHCYSTNGALDVNDKIQVLDTNGNVIPGLYACGTNSMGVLFTKETGYIDYGGVAHSWSFVSGKTAGQDAAQYAQSVK